MAVRTRIGASDLVYAVLDEDSDVAGGTPTWEVVTTLANAAKITRNFNGTGVVGYGDDRPAVVGETAGKIDFDFELLDMTPAAYAEILGYDYADGEIVKRNDSASPYIAVGWKVLRIGKDSGVSVYDYYWLYKGKMLKPTDTFETKKDTINLQNVMLKGMFVALQSDGTMEMMIRTDDPNVPAGTISAFFTDVLLPDADTGALSVTAAQGTTIHANHILFTFAKAGGGSLTVNAATLKAANVVVYNSTTNAILPGTWGAPTTGATSLVYFTPTTTPTAADVIVVAVAAGVKDSFNIACTPYAVDFAWT